jgi:phosphohistidine phosphatase
MFLYIMRHAEAVEDSETLQDGWRYLTQKGRVAAEEVISVASKLGPKPRLTITSPLTRAVQTAEIAVRKACRKNVTIASGLLLPGADLKEVMSQFARWKNAKRVMLVGHEPLLGSLVATLFGVTDMEISLKKGACVALEYDPEKVDKPASFIGYVVPGKKKAITSFKKAFPPADAVKG